MKSIVNDWWYFISYSFCVFMIGLLIGYLIHTAVFNSKYKALQEDFDSYRTIYEDRDSTYSTWHATKQLQRERRAY